MGVDIYLESIFNPFTENFEGSVADRRIQRRMRENPVRGVEMFYEVFRSSGGYFRNAYNCTDVMAAIGLSWGTVYAILDDKHRLPIERARELIAMIEARPLTRADYARHLESYGGGPLHNMMEQIKEEVTGEPPEGVTPEEYAHQIDAAFAFTSERREQLLAILRKSIAMNEPLKVC
jgi:hypothetical protein